MDTTLRQTLSGLAQALAAEGEAEVSEHALMPDPVDSAFRLVEWRAADAVLAGRDAEVAYILNDLHRLRHPHICRSEVSRGRLNGLVGILTAVDQRRLHRRAVDAAGLSR